MGDQRTNLNELVGIPPRRWGEDEEEYKLRVITEYANVIKEAILYDIHMGHVEWESAKMGLDEFCIGWVEVYVHNIIEGLSFEGIPMEV